MSAGKLCRHYRSISLPMRIWQCGGVQAGKELLTELSWMCADLKHLTKINKFEWKCAKMDPFTRSNNFADKNNCIVLAECTLPQHTIHWHRGYRGCRHTEFCTIRCIWCMPCGWMHVWVGHYALHHESKIPSVQKTQKNLTWNKKSGRGGKSNQRGPPLWLWYRLGMSSCEIWLEFTSSDCWAASPPKHSSMHKQVYAKLRSILPNTPHLQRVQWKKP